MSPTFSWIPASWESSPLVVHAPDKRAMARYRYAPWNGESHPLVVHAPNVVFEALRMTFGPFPLTLTTGNIPALRGMATSSLGERGYEDLLAALQDYGAITVTTKF